MDRIAFIIGLLLFDTLGHAQLLQRGEYFFDTDPGFGNATAITFTAAAQVELQLPISVSGLSPGGHILGIRMKDTAGRWGLTNRKSFTVAASVVGGDLVSGEYYFDIDPGIGSATPFTFPAAQQISSIQSFPVASLPPGGHVLGLRLKDSGGHWGLTNRRFFTVRSMAPGGDISRIEHFLDEDPGFGNGSQLTITAAPVITDLLFSVLTDELPAGAHRFFVRAQSSTGAWSITNSLLFNVAVGIDELAAWGITAGPNPMSDALVLRRASVGTAIDIDLLDAQGRRLRSERWTNDRLNLGTSDLSAGGYLLLLRMEGRHPLVLKVVKE